MRAAMIPASGAKCATHVQKNSGVEKNEYDSTPERCSFHSASEMRPISTRTRSPRSRLPRTQLNGRHPAYRDSARNIASDHGAGPDDRPSPDANAGQYRCAGADEDVSVGGERDKSLGRLSVAMQVAAEEEFQGRLESLSL